MGLRERGESLSQVAKNLSGKKEAEQCSALVQQGGEERAGMKQCCSSAHLHGAKYICRVLTTSDERTYPLFAECITLVQSD